MHAGRVEEAGVLAEHIGKDMTQRCKTHLCRISTKTDAKDLWAAVRQLTGRRQEAGDVAGITAESLNEHYAAISTDSSYTPPLLKHSAATLSQPEYISEWRVFQILDSLHPTATGLDQLPAWLLRLGAPLYYKSTRLFNLSLATSTIPEQWKQASIRPVLKVRAPSQHADFRPISITPVLTRVMERTVVQQFLYPTFLTSLLRQTCHLQTSLLSVHLGPQLQL